MVVVTGEGGNFSAGQDLKKFFRELENNPGERKKAAEAANRWRWERLYKYDKPTIAMVHGYCVGGAFMQLLACDFAIAADNATFSLSEVNWGILPGRAGVEGGGRHGAAAPCAVLRLPGRAVRRQGGRAHRHDQLRGAGQEAARRRSIDLAERLMKKSPAVLRATKQAIRHVRTMDVPQSYEYLAVKGQAIKVGRQGGFLQHGAEPVPRTRRATSRPTSRSSSAPC